MYISKQLLLVTVVSFGLHFQINASEYGREEIEQKIKNAQKVNDFSKELEKDARQKENARELETSRWIDTLYGTNQDLTELANIIDTNDSLETKANKLFQLKEGSGQKSYFSNISTFTKAAVFVIAAGIASYFYFMRPWSTSAQ